MVGGEGIMGFYELANKRYSVRSYKSKPVEEEKLAMILDAARLAPTAGNRQPFQVIVIHTEGKQEELLKIYPQSWFVKAPIILCVCGIPDIAWKRKFDNKQYYQVDAAIVMDYMILAATDLGLGTCFVAAFYPEVAKEILSIPDNIEPILFTSLGYADDSPDIKERKSLDELIRYEKW